MSYKCLIIEFWSILKNCEPVKENNYKINSIIKLEN